MNRYPSHLVGSIPDIESVMRPKPVGGIENEWCRGEDRVTSGFDDLSA
ncbi:MAG: hypothetical protein ACU85U_15515 [Gammaproteobacteria bacterium]|jgi:hypothetical protein